MSDAYTPGQQVKLIIMRETNLGYVAKINEVDEGLLYHNEVFERLERGQTLPGYIKGIRPDGTIDLLLQPFGNFGSDELGERILDALRTSGGKLPVNASSAAELVYEHFGVSRKKFKIAVGALYKRRLISITDDGLELIDDTAGAQKPGGN